MSGRVLGVAQVVTGIATLTAAPRVARQPWSSMSPEAMVAVVRVLGLRQAAQGLVTLARPRRSVLLAGAGVDALHALSLVPVLLADGPYRRQAAGSAVVALAAALAAVAAAGPDR